MAENEYNQNQQNTNNPFYDKDDSNIMVGDNYEFLTKFGMEPNLQHYGYGDELNHINKNLLFTNLNRANGETERVLNQLEIITILRRFYSDIEIEVPSGEFEKIESETNDQKIVGRPIMIKVKRRVYRFERLINYFSTKLYGITATAAGADSSLLKMMKTAFVSKDQTIEDRTETTRGFWGKLKNKQNR